MKNTFFLFLTIVTILTLLPGCGPSAELTIAERRQVVSDMETQTLQRLYREKPSTRETVKNAAGYGVFSNANVNVIFVSAGGGYGVVVDNETKQRTYMKMALGGVGLGLGAKDYRVVMIFKDKSTLDNFIESGWDAGAHADAAAKAGESGGELSAEGDIIPGIEVYSMTESGLALQATIAGTKYWKDNALN